jgi:hypothetical protein
MQKDYRVHFCGTRTVEGEVEFNGRKVKAAIPVVIAELVPLGDDGVNGTLKVEVDPKHLGIFADHNVLRVSFALNDEATKLYQSSPEFIESLTKHKAHVAAALGDGVPDPEPAPAAANA